MLIIRLLGFPCVSLSCACLVVFLGDVIPQRELAEAQHRTISQYLSLQVLLDGCKLTYTEK